MSSSPAFTKRDARKAAREAGLVAQESGAGDGFMLIQPANSAVVARELTAAEVVTYCEILSATESFGRRVAPPLTGGPPVRKRVPPPGGERGTSNVYVLGSRDRTAPRRKPGFSS
jgi:hypothetical protein